MSVFTQILPNQVILITEPVAEAKTAAIGFWFDVGSRHEGQDCRGITHFVEHMLFKGTTTKSAFDIAVSFDRIGGYLNAFTERENMCLHCVVPGLHISTAMEVICDMVQNSTFEELELERERAVIESEIISSQDDPEEVAMDAASEAVWPLHSVSSPIAGNVADVRKLTRKTIFEWYNNFITHGPLVVCVSGCFEKELIIQYLSNLPLRKKTSTFNLEKPKWNTGIVFNDAPFQQNQFFLQLPISHLVDEKQYFALLILNAMIGDTMSSRLFQSLREKGGYSYNVYSFLTFYSDAACWCAYSSASKKNTFAVTETLLSQLKKLLVEGFSTEEIKAACEHLCGEEIIFSEDMEYRMKRLFRNHSFGFPQRSAEETTEIIRKIPLELLDTTLKSILDFSAMNFMIYGSKPGIGLRKKIKSFIQDYIN